MILKTRTADKPQHGDLKVVTKFAWFPRWVDNKKIWLCRYQILYEYRVRARYPPLFIGKYQTPRIPIRCGDWDKISEKLMKTTNDNS